MICQYQVSPKKFMFCLILYYCTISNCSAWPVTHDHCAEILLRQRPVWHVILAKFQQTKIWAGHSQAWVQWVLSKCFVTAGQGQCDPWYTPISAPSKGPVTRDTPNNSKWYSKCQWPVKYKPQIDLVFNCDFHATDVAMLGWSAKIKDSRQALYLFFWLYCNIFGYQSV